MQTSNDNQPAVVKPDIEAARAELHRIVDAAFDENDATRLVILKADDERLRMYAVGVSETDLAQIMEMSYAQYQERFYGMGVPGTVQ